MNPLLWIALAASAVFLFGFGWSFGYIWPSRFHFYRRWLGGTWYLVTPYPYHYIHIWVREPLQIEHVDKVETY